MKPHSECDISPILAHDRLALARAISRIENNRDGAGELHDKLLPHCGRAHVIGITGAPGAGKSTLINVLLQELLRRERRIAVVAVDPSSPISGGAILGDRVRMADHGSNDAIFIRSVSSRGHLGGLSRTTGKIIDVFDAAGFDTVIVETVGTGQSEVEITRYADTRIVVCPPGLGDEVQAIKAGILEIADILVVNKGDLPSAQRTQLDLEVMGGFRHPSSSGWQVPVMRTVATSGEGVKELIDKAEAHARLTGVGQRLRNPSIQHPSAATHSMVDFGEFPCDAALGLTLAHSMQLDERKLKKGRVLDPADIQALKRAGIHSIIGAKLGANDLTEDAAAASLALLLAGDRAEARQPYTGRCNIHSSARGVVTIDADCIRRVNQLDEALTVATLPPWTVVRKGQVIATVKTIPFGVNRSVIDACRLVVKTPPLSVAELRPHRAALILSELPGMKESVFTNATLSTRQRLETLGSRLAFELRCRHQPEALEHALRQSLAAGCEMILIFGATIAKDRNDVAPAAIVAAGGTIERFGMPVEPGNMLLLGRIAAVPVIVLPGCARSRRLNGLDWVLRRLLAKLPVSAADIGSMGIGGLIRSSPDEGDEQETAALLPPLPEPDPSIPRIAALVLAAGRSSRMDGHNKLLAQVDGIPLVVRAVNAALASRASSVTVVTGHDADQIAAILADRPVALVRNPDYADGMASSLRCGVTALPADTAATVVLLADMPFITAEHIDALIEKFLAHAAIVVLTKDGKRGNPVLWPRSYFQEIMAIKGDQGARPLLARHTESITSLETISDAVFADVDTPEMLATLRTRQA